jgi:hypothetical protein
MDSVVIGGSLIGGANISSGSLFLKEIGSLSIAGSILGGAKQYSGIVECVELGTLKIRGDLRGGSGTDSGLVMAASSIGLVKIGGDLAGGSGAASGQIIARPTSGAAGTIGPVYIGGSIIGSGGYSGALFGGDIQSVNVRHDVVGGTGSFSGAIMADEKLGRVAIGGSVVGGDAEFSGALMGGSGIATVSIGGDLKAGAVANAGIIFAGYDQSGGSDRAKLGAVKIKGNLLGSADVPALIFATGSADIDKPFPLVIKSITVQGNVEFARILAGYDAFSRGALMAVSEP